MKYDKYFYETLTELREDWDYRDLYDLVTSVIPAYASKAQWIKIPFLALREREFYMAFDNWKLISCRIDEKHEKDLDKFASKFTGGYPEVVQRVAEHGCKLSITWVDQSNAWCVSISAPKKDHPNARKTLTSWSDDFHQATIMCLYKHEVLFSGGIWEDLTVSSQWG